MEQNSPFKKVPMSFPKKKNHNIIKDLIKSSMIKLIRNKIWHLMAVSIEIKLIYIKVEGLNCN